MELIRKGDDFELTYPSLAKAQLRKMMVNSEAVFKL